ncbi:MAG TPA: flagellar hook protein FlgE [Rhodothermales bacterium]|nr:flagellar hook protein FlgE [Rhodothermales bacterium]
MIRSLRTGVAGLKSNQVRMDVVGNNIANVNTVAFKRSRVAFGEVLGQQMLGRSENPSVVGLGVLVGSIDQNWGQGSLETTGVATDLALKGDGFFVVKAGDRPLLTRAGNFTFNREGELVTTNGFNVQGWALNPDGTSAAGAPGNITLNFDTQSPAKYSTEASFAGNVSADMAVGDKTSMSMQLYDEQGAPHDVVINLEKTAANTWQYDVASSETPSPFTGNITGGSLTFNVDGSFDTASDTTLTWDTGYVDSGADINLDFSGLTQYSGSTTGTFRSQDGYAVGSLVGYQIDSKGILQVSYSNGQELAVSQLAIGHVNNPQGLEQQGENFYATGATSGDLQLGRAGGDLSTSVVEGALEMSNVDLATEFTDMIIAQRGYQASARIITTSDEMLQETVQLKR